MSVHLAAPRVVSVALLLLTCLVPAVFGQTQGSTKAVVPMTGPCDLGIIFDTSNIQLDLSSYQAGAGVKIGLGKLGFRGSFGLTINGSAASSDIGAGIVMEYHLTPDPVSFYVGGSLKGDYLSQNGVSSIVPLSVGALAGIEIFPFDFLSLFVEYAIAFNLTFVTTTSTSQTTVNYLLQTGIGNDAKIGLTLYFMRIAKRK